MSKCFCKSYSEIMQAFMCLEKERTLEESQDIDIDDCIWLILYCITWFFVYRISSDNLIGYSIFLNASTFPDFL